MKTKSPLKIIFMFLAFLIVLSGVILVVAKKNLKPEAIRVAFTKQLQKTLPNAEVITQSLDYSLGLNSKVNIRKVEILYPHGARKLPLCSFQNLQIEVPFWTMLMGYGTISINIDKPKVNYIELKKGSNWENSFEQKEKVSFGKSTAKSTTPVSSEDKGASAAGLSVLSFFSDATINFNVTNIEATYALREGGLGEIKIDKLVLRDIGLNTTTAFELKSKFHLSKGKPSESSFNLLLIGETNLSNWLDKKTLDYNAEININNISSGIFVKPLKQISVNMIGQMINEHLKSKITVALEEHQFMKSNLDYDLSRKQLSLNSIDLNTNLHNFLSHFVNIEEFGTKIKDGTVKVSGSILSRENLFKPDITSSIQADVETMGIPVKLNMKTNLGPKLIRSAVELNTLEGTIKIGQSTPFIIGVDRFDYLKTSIINLHVKDIVIPTKLNQTGISAKSNTTTTSNDVQDSDVDISGTDADIFSKFPIKSKVLFSNTLLGDAPINGQLNFSVNRKQLSLKSNKLKIGTAPLDINMNSVINKKYKDTTLSAKFTGVDIASAGLFVPDSIVRSIEGKASGVLNGKMKNKEYDFNVDLSVKEAKFNKINISKVMGGIFNKVQHLTKKDLKIDGEINEVDFKGRFDDRLHQIKAFKAIVDNGNYALVGSGKIDFKTNGELLGNIQVNDQELKHDLERDIGTASIPFRLEGIGYNLSSDYKYTLEEITKSAAKKALKKEADKAVKKNKEKLKKMLKGIFK